MGDVFAIVSKAVFEKEANVDLGDVWPVARYNGAAKVFETTLADGGRIFMVTVRPPDEQLWLLAVLESPTFDSKTKAWTAKPNVVAATDISSLRKSIKFESGKGMSQDKGALGMSLQTPRALGDGDAEQILALLGGKGGGKAAPAAKAAAPAEAKKSTRSRDRVAALLAAIRDEPDDEANRQVLADQYEAAGDEDRARFIRSQVARAALPRWDARVVAMELDEREILSRNEAKWIAELPAFKGVSWVGFERGLPAKLSFDDPASIPKHIETAMTASPITGIVMRWPRRGSRPKLDAIEGLRTLTITGTVLQAADMTWLAKSPILSTVEELTLVGSRLNDKVFAALLASEHLGKLRRLRLPMHNLGNKGIELLCEVELPRLVELDLSQETMDRLGSGGRDGDGINGEGIVALCEWPQMAKLERLDLTGIQLGEAGLTTLLTSKNTKRITTLKLRSVSDYDFENDERPDVLPAFAEAANDRFFEELDVGENELSNAGVKALIGCPALAKLKIFAFDFSHNDTGLAKVLADAKWLDEVHVLSLQETTLGVVKKVLGRAPKSLHTLSLLSSFPRSSLQGIAGPLTATPAQKSLQSLDLFGCNVEDAALEKLGKAKTLPALISLRVGPNTDNSYGDDEPTFSDEAAEEFLSSPLGKQLRSVTFGNAKLDKLPRPGSGAGASDDDDDDEYDDDDE